MVISDRYADATVAYQGAGRGFPPELISQIVQLATGGLKPDLTLLFDVSIEESTSRTTRRSSTLGEFGVVLMVGGNLPGETRTLSVAIYDRMQAFDDRSAGVMAATLLVIAVATLMTTTTLSRRVGTRRG